MSFFALATLAKHRWTSVSQELVLAPHTWVPMDTKTHRCLDPSRKMVQKLCIIYCNCAFIRLLISNHLWCLNCKRYAIVVKLHYLETNKENGGLYMFNANMTAHSNTSSAIGWILGCETHGYRGSWCHQSGDSNNRSLFSLVLETRRLR